MSGGYGRKRKIPLDDNIIPDYQVLFEEDGIKKYWTFILERYNLSKKWQEKYNHDLLNTPRGISTLEFFFQFQLDFINPILTSIRYTSSDDKMVFKIAKHLIQDRINMKMQESNFERNYYWNSDRRQNNKRPQRRI